MIGGVILDNSIIKEELSINYISTISSIAGISYQTIRRDEDSTDGILRKVISLENNGKFNAELRVQLKCTSSINLYTDDENVITYKLKVKNYNDLCMPATSPIILGLLILPDEKDEWVKWTTNELMIKGCMYWLSLANKTPSDNAGTVTVKINKKNVLNQESLHILLEKIAKEEDL